jgi:hypothetical protein
MTLPVSRVRREESLPAKSLGGEESRSSGGNGKRSAMEHWNSSINQQDWMGFDAVDIQFSENRNEINLPMGAIGSLFRN